MYFNSSPNIKQALRPLKFPFSEGDYVIAKNFFKRYELSEKVFSNLVFFKQYTIQDKDRLDLLAERYYGDVFYDWVILLTNNMIRGVYDWPLDSRTLQKSIESQYDTPYDTVHHYETLELKSGFKQDGIDVIALEGGLRVDEAFYNGTFSYNNGTSVVTVPGNQVSVPVTIYANAERENNKKRQIYILKKQYLTSFVNAFKRGNTYEKSSDFVSNKLKNALI